MFNGIFQIPQPINEPTILYEPGSPKRAALKAKLQQMLSTQIEVPMIIGGEEVRNGKLAEMRCPHDHQHVLGTYHEADASYVTGRLMLRRMRSDSGVPCPGNPEPWSCSRPPNCWPANTARRSTPPPC